MKLKWMVIGALALVLTACGSDEKGDGVFIDCADDELYDQVNETCVPRDGEVDQDAGNAMTTDMSVDEDGSMGVDSGNNNIPSECDFDGDGSLKPSCGGDDCDDENIRRAPSYPEICDLVDNNCNDEVNEGIVCTFYGHSGSNLYRIDPFLKTAEEVAADLPNLQDIDTNPLDEKLYGITSDGLFRLDEARNEWSRVGDFGIEVQDPNGLAIDSRGDAYVTGQDKLYLVDTETGAATLVGEMGGEYYSSGDCVLNKRDTLFMTSKHLEGVDSLLVLRTNDASVTEVGEVGAEEVFGLTAAWGNLYGLTRGGDLIEINSVTGESRLVHNFEGISWFGAASTPER